MPNGAPEVPDFRTRHRDLLERAVTTPREHRTPYPESPGRTVYGEDAAGSGEATFREQAGRLAVPQFRRPVSAPAEESA
ncbi:hypothetical protein [Streptomyces sediminimaris]|uniref:hypothetical protein n=1 Tax=Streptomyces sediminimaris TaxID=3383721 RepID=UPI00399B8AD3